MIAQNWSSGCRQKKMRACIVWAGILLVGVNHSAIAQVVPDNTLGAESSVVTPNLNIRGIDSDRIDGGAAETEACF